ncbi:hypothetical protein Scep_009723 [Stephania cephalantha]|uniref:Uncharacterized protein n=1 Tax=Stephania cephalantha TaxID=152367 RepID=A0AAP0JW67_9MAGN
MSSPQIPQNEKNQQFQQNTSLKDMMKQLIEGQHRLNEDFKQFEVEFPGLHNLETQLIQFNARLQNMFDKEDLCSTQPIIHLEENMNVNMLKNVEVDEVTQVEDYWSETSEGIEVFQIELEIVIAQNKDEENELKIEVISERREEPQKESNEDQPLVLVKPPTLPCILVKPYKGVEVNEHSQIFYTADTFVLDDHYATDSFVMEVLNELLNLKEGVQASLPEYVDTPFIVDISLYFMFDEHWRTLGVLRLGWDISNLSCRISGVSLRRPKTLDFIPSSY